MFSLGVREIAATCSRAVGSVRTVGPHTRPFASRLPRYQYCSGGDAATGRPRPAASNQKRPKILLRMNPTGNLDAGNQVNGLSHLCSSETSLRNHVIIVQHDTDLAGTNASIQLRVAQCVSDERVDEPVRGRCRKVRNTKSEVRLQGFCLSEVQYWYSSLNNHARQLDGGVVSNTNAEIKLQRVIRNEDVSGLVSRNYSCIEAKKTQRRGSSPPHPPLREGTPGSLDKAACGDEGEERTGVSSLASICRNCRGLYGSAGSCPRVV